MPKGAPTLLISSSSKENSKNLRPNEFSSKEKLRKRKCFCSEILNQVESQHIVAGNGAIALPLGEGRKPRRKPHPEPRIGIPSGAGFQARNAKLSRQSRTRSARHIPRPHGFWPPPLSSGFRNRDRDHLSRNPLKKPRPPLLRLRIAAPDPGTGSATVAEAGPESATGSGATGGPS